MLYRLLMAALLFNFGVQAHAMSIGNLTVASSLGEPLRVRIAVTLDQDTLPDDGCFTLTGPSSHEAPLRDAHLGLISINGQRYISIHTLNPVSDPIVDLSLRAEGCGPTMQKDFVILLSPKGMDIDASQPTAIAPPVVEPAAEPAPAPRAARPKHHPRSVARVHRATAKAHPKTVRHHRRNTAPSGNFALHLDYSFNSLGRYADQIAKERQQARNGKPSIPAPAAQGDKLVLGSDIPPPLPDHDAAGRPVQPVQPPQAAGVAAQAGSGGGPVLPSQHGIGNGPLPSTIAPAPATPSDWLLSSFGVVLLLVVLLLLLALLIALWLKWRSQPANRTPERIAADLNTLMPPNPAAPQPRSAAPGPRSMEHDFAEARTETRHPLAATFEQTPAKPQPPRVVPIDTPTVTPKLAPMGDFTMEQFDTADHVLELAEVMLAFGRSNQAIETLSQYIESHPNQAVEPWVRLLDLYRQSDLRSEFEALAADLHKRFNVVLADWNDYGVPASANTLTLESLPHIMDRLTSSWGTEVCLDYLEKLLADNRGGQRHGFSLPLVRDILLLRDILRQTAPNPYRDSLTS
jgi:pilus assembly protein FimV